MSRGLPLNVKLCLDKALDSALLSVETYNKPAVKFKSGGYIDILNEGEAKHLGGVAQAQFSINSDYFKDKYVILFDDVITSGRSMENFKRLLEGSGAKVIAGLSIGKTRHEREFSQPIDNI